MSTITEWHEVHEGRGGVSLHPSHTAEIQQFWCKTDDPLMTFEQVKLEAWAQGWLPVQGSYLRGSFSQTCRKISGRQRANAGLLVWDLSCEFDSAPESLLEQEKRDQPYPPFRKARVRIQYERLVKAVDKDVDTDEPILNSAGEPFSEPILVPGSKAIIAVTKNFAEPPSFMTDCADRINADAVSIWTPFGFFGTCAPKTLLFTPLDMSDPELENGYMFTSCSYQLEYNPDTHDPDLINRGLKELKAGQLVKIIDDDGDPVLEPWFLDVDGAALSFPLDPSEVTSERKRAIKTADFSGIPTY